MSERKVMHYLDLEHIYILNQILKCKRVRSSHTTCDFVAGKLLSDLVSLETDTFITADKFLQKDIIAILISLKVRLHSSINSLYNKKLYVVLKDYESALEEYIVNHYGESTLYYKGRMVAIVDCDGLKILSRDDIIL